MSDNAEKFQPRHGLTDAEKARRQEALRLAQMQEAQQRAAEHKVTSGDANVSL